MAGLLQCNQPFEAMRLRVRLANEAMHAGQHTQAMQLARVALEEGPRECSMVAQAQGVLLLAAVATHDEDCAGYLVAVQQTLEARGEPSHPLLMRLHEDIALHCAAQQDWPACEHHLREAIARFEASLGRPHRRLAQLWLRLGMAAQPPEHKLAALSKALTMAVETAEDGPDEQAATLICHGVGALLELGDVAQARYLLAQTTHMVPEDSTAAPWPTVRAKVASLKSLCGGCSSEFCDSATRASQPRRSSVLAGSPKGDTPGRRDTLSRANLVGDLMSQLVDVIESPEAPAC